MRHPDTVQLTTNISSNITNAIHFSTPPTLAHQPPYPRWHKNHVTLVAMSPTLACQPRNPSQHASTPPTLVHHPRHPSHPRQYVTHASTPPCHPCQHATYASTSPTPPTLARIASHFSNTKLEKTMCRMKYIFHQSRK